MACIFFTPFPKSISLFLRRFFRKFCPYVWLVFKIGLWWRAYGIYTSEIAFPNCLTTLKSEALHSKVLLFDRREHFSIDEWRIESMSLKLPYYLLTLYLPRHYYLWEVVIFFPPAWSDRISNVTVEKRNKNICDDKEWTNRCLKKSAILFNTPPLVHEYLYRKKYVLTKLSIWDGKKLMQKNTKNAVHNSGENVTNSEEG